MFERVLIANRGEIAVRVMAACQELGVRTIAVYSEADRDAYHVRRADEAYPIGPAPATASYLDVPAIITAARASGAQAIHPGYGFLSENADFAQACTDGGIVFIGPPPDAIRLMGSKIAAKRAVEESGVPTVPGYSGSARDARTLLKEAQRIGFPVMIKASAGGGGKGMRVVDDAAHFADALEGARREAQAAFGDDSVFLEKLVVSPRHVEFQVLADAFGNVIHLGERECSIQRRHQKIVEESPCVALTPALRDEMGRAAVAAARAAGYVNAGTCEFLLDQDGRYYFLEMNTRLQVEHPVTELVTGVDLVHQQLRIAAGERLQLEQASMTPRGHAIEVRIYAEDPANGFLPSTGAVHSFDVPHAPGIRLDAGVEAGDPVTMHYDPLLAKLIVHAEDRDAAARRMQWALDHVAVLGVTTNVPLLRTIVADEAFLAGQTTTSFLADRGLTHVAASDAVPWQALAAAAMSETLAAPSATQPAVRSPWSAGSSARGGPRRFRFHAGQRDHVVELAPEGERRGAYRVTIDGEPAGGDAAGVLTVTARAGKLTLRYGVDIYQCAVARASGDGVVHVAWRGRVYTLATPRPPDVDAAARGAEATVGQQRLVAPMAGTVIKVNVAEGEAVEQYQTLVVLGAMKMEHAITAPYAGFVRRVAHAPGDVVPGGEPLIELEAPPSHSADPVPVRSEAEVSR
jgi:3-methylcrotonyl-CoA carboxylase alpha subunit